MNKTMKIAVVVSLVVVAALVIAIKQQDKSAPSKQVVAANPDTVSGADTDNAAGNLKNPPQTRNLPRLVDLGADKCIPCRMMKPILDELKQEYKQRFEVVFIDVWKKPDQARKYKIKVIPTQIFFDASGKELFRHEGFYSKDDILGKWKEFGVNVEKKANNETN